MKGKQGTAQHSVQDRRNSWAPIDAVSLLKPQNNPELSIPPKKAETHEIQAYVPVCYGMQNIKAANEKTQRNTIIGACH